MKIIFCKIFILLILCTSCGSSPPISHDPIAKSDTTLIIPAPEIKFAFPEYFGSDFDFTAEIIKKPNTYYAKNYMKASFIFNVISINGEKLINPVIIYPTPLYTGKYKIGSVQHFRGYEILEETGELQIKGEEPNQMNLNYSSRMVILEPLKKENKKDVLKNDENIIKKKTEYPLGVHLAFPEQFGSDFEFTAELIRKSNTYYEPNYVSNPFKFKVITVNGNKLSPPVIIDPIINYNESYRIGDVLNFRGYEKIKELGLPNIRGSNKKAKMQAMNLHYISQLVVTKILNKK